ncbi:MAG: flagellar hook capping FlgD N-terminal domain-containing protein [Bdellovibrionota bacterium]
MADGIGSFSVVDKLDPSFTSTPSRNVDNKAEVNKDEFLQLLVVQLQNQDPLDPMKNEDFAVNLAQFTQVEQLIDINDKLGKQQDKGTDMSSLASYLGHEVALLSDTLDVEGGNGGSIKFNLDKAAANLTLDLLKSDGSIAKSVSLGSSTKAVICLTLTDLGYQQVNTDLD